MTEYLLIIHNGIKGSGSGVTETVYDSTTKMYTASASYMYLFEDNDGSYPAKFWDQNINGQASTTCVSITEDGPAGATPEVQAYYDQCKQKIYLQMTISRKLNISSR